MTESESYLGRLPSFDERDKLYPMRAALPRMEPRFTYRYWYPPPETLDQGATSSCVGHSLRHFLDCSPERSYGIGDSAMGIYHRAQRIDEWPGEDYEGTSVRAGIKVLEQDGHIAQYLWAFGVHDIERWVLERGPVVMGTDWYASMFEPDEHGIVKLDGPVVGGHAFLCLGVNTKTGLFTCLNSWGPEWGHKGRFRIRREDLETLLINRGEAVTVVERPIIKPEMA